MDYKDRLRLLLVDFMQLQSLFHKIYQVEMPMYRHRITNIRRYQVLKILEMEGEINLTGLCQGIQLRKNSCSELLDRMMKDSLISRLPSDSDRRMTYFSLTERGKEAVKEFEEMMAGRLAEWFKDLSEQEVAGFMSALSTLIDLSRKIKI